MSTGFPGSPRLGFPGSPRLAKGALISVSGSSAIPTDVVSFQYNPETVTRAITPNSVVMEDGSQADQLRLKGPPTERLTIQIEIDAVDQLERSTPMAVSYGIAPVLASLELFLYPTSTLVMADNLVAALGAIEISPIDTPLTLLVWNATRVLPIRLTELRIDEEAFDPSLNPIRAKVTLQMVVLTYEDLGIDTLGGVLALTNQIGKETLVASWRAAGSP